MINMEKRSSLLCILLLSLFLGPFVQLISSAPADLSSCPDALTKLLPCLPYSQGTSQIPTKDCCTNLETIHEKKPQCLCELIAASVNGTAGLPKMNTTLALSLGPACNVATKPAVCPDLLGLSSDDPLTKVFTSGSTSTASNSTTTPVLQSPVGNSTAGSSTSPPASNSPSLPMRFWASLLLAVAAFSVC